MGIYETTKSRFGFENIILLGFGGSIAYGTNTPESDTDIRGVVSNTKEELLGLDNDRESIVFF